MSVDQILFGPGNHGLITLKSSMDTFRTHQWESRLVQLIRLESLDDHSIPDTSLSYFRFVNSDHAAVMRRTDTGRTTGRNYAHALIGSSDVLTPRCALALHQWQHWVDKEDNVKLKRLRAETLPSQPLLDQKVRQEWLVALVAALLEQPRGNLTVVGTDEHDRIPLLCGALDVLGGLFAGMPAPRTWSFSTYEREVDYTTKSAAEIVFLPGINPGVTRTAGRVVELERFSSADGPRWAAAATIVDAYLRRNLVVSADQIAENCNRNDFEARLTSLLDVLEAMAEPVHPAVPNDDRSTPQLSLSQLVAELVNTNSPDHGANLVRRLRGLDPAPVIEQRTGMRDALLEMATQAPVRLEIAELEPDFHQVILKHCFGADLLDLSAEDPETLDRTCQLVASEATDEQLVLAFFDLAQRAGKSDLLLSAIGLRTMRSHGRTVVEPRLPPRRTPAPPGPRHSDSGQPVPVVLHSPELPRTCTDFFVSYGSVLVLIGTLLFLIGLVLGVAYA